MFYILFRHVLTFYLSSSVIISTSTENLFIWSNNNTNDVPPLKIKFNPSFTKHSTKNNSPVVFSSNSKLADLLSFIILSIDSFKDSLFLICYASIFFSL